MGNFLSQILAELATNPPLQRTLKQYNPEDISFISKLVDDIIAAMKKEYMKSFKAELERQTGKMRITMTNENNNL